MLIPDISKLPSFSLAVEIPPDGKALVYIGGSPETMGPDGFKYWMAACEYMLAVTASRSGAGYEKALELLVQGAMTYKHIVKPSKEAP